jgi:hypothetical protein
LLRYVLNNREMVVVAPVITGMTFVFKFHIHCVSGFCCKVFIYIYIYIYIYFLKCFRLLS